MLFIFSERLRVCSHTCRMLSVLWLTPHTVWTVTVVTQHTRVMPSPLFLQERIRELCANALGRPTPNVKKCSESSGNFYTNIPRRCGSSRQKNSEAHNIRTRSGDASHRTSPLIGCSRTFARFWQRKAGGRVASVDFNNRTVIGIFRFGAPINCLWSSSMWRYMPVEHRRSRL